MRFTKMHGAGNDYVYVDLFDEALDVEDAPALARAMSDRHAGVGADGLILVGRSGTAHVRMTMFNADGSRAEMCGNGIRCVAKLARDHARCDDNPMLVETDGGVKEIELQAHDGVVTGARVNMGTPVLEPEAVPVRLDGARVVERELEILDRIFRITCISMGNPHCVIYVDDVERFDVERYGRAVERHEIFPHRTNVEFVEIVDPDTVRQRTWERGSGETLACGTGACAAGVAGVLTGRTGAVLADHLRGGVLTVEWDGDGPVFLSGPAVTVFEGDWPR